MGLDWSRYSVEGRELVGTLRAVSLDSENGAGQNTRARRNKLDFVFYAYFFIESTAGLHRVLSISNFTWLVNNLAWKRVHINKFLSLKVLVDFRYLDVRTC